MKTVEDLRRLRDEVRSMTALREGEADVRIVVGMGTCGIAAGARETLNTFVREIALQGLTGVVVTQTGCIGICEREPVVEINARDGRTLYGRVTPEKARRIVLSHVMGGTVIEEWVTRN
ncbi:MAG: (2Fe-2S) ferredoxin domain-containing protein [Firmicutes bacterium]|nr:(2Fe-2S) ferredoxin domain-containing protein [Dethiobacter sp.]MBS3888933.1 (2Fe-2S) ferredoxin domain-containing protein [Bacillota bacterium]MBS4053553.1 (2Fe-2S) ferredoxin domain-containing protein [Thermaerobacter sp.]